MPAAAGCAGLRARHRALVLAVHDEDDACLGQPICLECFDHQGAVLWNNLLGELWRRTPIYLPRKLARQLGITQERLQKLVRIAT